MVLWESLHLWYAYGLNIYLSVWKRWLYMYTSCVIWGNKFVINTEPHIVVSGYMYSCVCGNRAKINSDGYHPVVLWVFFLMYSIVQQRQPVNVFVYSTMHSQKKGCACSGTWNLINCIISKSNLYTHSYMKKVN